MKLKHTLNPITKFLLGFVLLLLSYTAKATYSYGCVSDDTKYIYPNEAYNGTFETSPVKYMGSGDYCQPTYVGTCRIRSRNDCRMCTGPYNEGSWYKQDIWYYQSGKEYRYLPCPIDGQTGFLLISTIGIGVIFIRRKI